MLQPLIFATGTDFCHETICQLERLLLRPVYSGAVYGVLFPTQSPSSQSFACAGVVVFAIFKCVDIVASVT